MLTQKLYKNGNSIAVTIPKQYLEDLDLHDGSQVVVDKRGDQLIIASKKKVITNGLDQEFVTQVDEFMKDHHDTLEKLAHL